MKKLILVVLLALGLSPIANGQSAAEKFGTIAETWDAEISPDGKNLALGCSPKGQPAVCIYALDSDVKPRLIPPPPNARITGLYWASSQYLIFSVNTVEVWNGRDDVLISRLLSYDMETGKSELLMRNARAVTNTTNIESMLVDNPKKVLMALVFDLRTNATKSFTRIDKSASKDNYILYEVDLKSGKAKVKEKSAFGGIIFDERGKKHATILRDYKKNYFAVKSNKTNKKVFEDKDAALAPFYVEGLSDDRSHLIVDFDKGARDGLYTLSLTDGEIEPYKVNGKFLGDIGLLKDRHRASVIGYFATDDITEATYTDPELIKVQQQVRDALKVDDVWLNSWTRNRSDFIVSATKPGRPSQYYIYNPATPSLSPVGGQAPWLDEAPLGIVSKITYSSRDGVEIPAYLTLPPGKTKADGPFPLVLMPHGGPESRDTADYDWLAQAVASQGFVVLQPNFRGSAGYGAAFRNAGYGEFGGKMVTDVLDGATHLVSSGVAKSGGHCTMGWSYGGYSALMTGLLDPANTKCVISINGVTDPFELMNKGPVTLAYWERYMGDLYQSGENKRAITPIDRADEYAQPLLLIHGNEDTTVPYEQAQKFARKTDRARLIPMPGDDHGMYNTNSRRKVLEESLAFLAEHHPVK